MYPVLQCLVEKDVEKQVYSVQPKAGEPGNEANTVLVFICILTSAGKRKFVPYNQKCYYCYSCICQLLALVQFFFLFVKTVVWCYHFSNILSMCWRNIHCPTRSGNEHIARKWLPHGRNEVTLVWGSLRLAPVSYQLLGSD